MTWSANVAEIAQSYAEQLASMECALVHSDSGLGENLATFAGDRPGPAQVVQLWARERECYTYGAFQRTDACSCEACGHYTQIIWKNTTHLGCGVAQCDDRRQVWVCNYDPPGNYVGQEPY